MDGSDLSIMLHSPEEKQGVGMPIPIKVEVRNLSQQRVWIVGVVDGSEDAIRYPHYLPRISMAGQVVAEPPPLAPGEAFDPTNPDPGAKFLPISTFSNFRSAVPGRFEFSLILSTQSQYPEQWLGSFGQDAERSAVLERLAQVPRLTVRSNVLQVEVI
jgi:hypothetical protein